VSARAYRVDSFVAVLDFAPGATTQPGVAAVVRTPEGYLDVDAYIARDGCLTYSDGRESWLEYRPRAELIAAANTWGVGTPVTDDHPKRMVDATTWVAVARGVHLTEARVEGPLADGRSYLRARLRISDHALVAKIDAGQRELSIGFSAAIVPLPGGVHPDGTRADAVQCDLEGNHTASVKRGRAGPVCAVMMDGAAIACHTRPEFGFAPEKAPAMKKTPAQIAAARAKFDAATKLYLDEIGSPQEMVPVKGPDGVEVMMPSWAAAMLGELVALKQAQSPAAPASPAQAPAAPNAANGATPLAPPAQPQVPAIAAVAPPVPGAPAPVAAAVPGPAGAPAIPALPAPAAPDTGTAPAAAAPAEEDPDKSKEKPMDAATVSRTARKRARLERLAATAGVPESSSDPKIVTLDADDDVLAREFVKRVIPTAKVEALKGDALDALVDTAASMPKIASANSRPKRGDAVGNPWETPKPRENVADDPEVVREAKRMIADGAA
jgi:hypothetical protein